jgi:inner membrane protease subunit 2
MSLLHRLLRSPRARLPVFLAKSAVFGYLGLQLLDTYAFTARFVTGPSMAPTLSPNFSTTGERDVMLLMRLNHAQPGELPPGDARGGGGGGAEEESARTAGLRRGDVVSFHKPHDPSSTSVKRVLALPGDTVTRDAAARRRARTAGEGANARRRGMAPMPDGPFTVPPGHVWVEGDAWRNSLDSNDFGAVPVNLVTGRAVAIVWPPRRFGRIPARAEGGRSGTKVAPGGAAVAREYDWERELEFR